MILFFAIQRSFTVSTYHLLIVDLSSYANGVLLKIFSYAISSKLFHTFYSYFWTYMRSLIHVKLSFVQGNKNRYIFILLHAVIQFEEDQLLKKLNFFSEYISSFFIKTWVFMYMRTYVLVFNSFDLSIKFFQPIPCYFDYYTSVVQIAETRDGDTH